VLSASQLSGDNTEALSPTARPLSQSIAVQTVGTEPFVSIPEPPPPPEVKPEVVTYNKGVQTDDLRQGGQDSSSLDSDGEDALTSNKKQRERDEEIRKKLRKEIEEELQATQQNHQNEDGTGAALRYPMRTLDDDELKAVTSSDDFLDFVERSAKVIERALDEEYDVLADYELGGVDAEMEEDDEHGKKKRGIKEVCQFWDERWSKKRMITDISFSPKVCSRLSIRYIAVVAYSLKSFLNWSSQHTPRTLQHPMSQTVLFKSGTSTCTPVRSMCFTPPLIS
jgi:dynein intermediate chain